METKRGTLLGLAIAIAAQAHQNQTDKGGHAYILHPIRLMMRLRTTDEDLMCIAILHDCLEDTGVTVTALDAHGFPMRVLSALALLTHDPEDSYDVYICRIATNRDAILVKLEDLRDNSDITRLKGLRPEDLQRTQKYHRAFVYLQSTLETMTKVGY